MTHPATLLVIIPLSGSNGGFTLPLYAARGLTQTLEPIQGNIIGSGAQRDVNGNLVDLTNPAFRKYSTTVECSDVEAPALDGAWLGTTVQMACACELGYVTGGTPQRPEVSGSSRVEGLFTFYRPILIVKITEINHSFEEWQHGYKWRLGAQEI